MPVPVVRFTFTDLGSVVALGAFSGDCMLSVSHVPRHSPFHAAGLTAARCTIVCGIPMGVWGTGLYSGDFAMDLRSTVRAVARLPFDSERLLQILCQTESTAANNPQDEDHTTFWLVVADQFDKRGIDNEQARNRALQIIDAGEDLAMLAKLRMTPSDLNRRRKMLAELRARVASPPPPKPRPVLKKPQPFLMELGDVFILPSDHGTCINPYFPSKEKMPGGWHPDGWNAFAIVDRGRAFDFLAWYRPLVLNRALSAKPGIEDLRAAQPWSLERPGTCPASHFKKMDIELVGTVKVDLEKLRSAFPSVANGIYEAVNDISICNRLSTRLLGKPIGISGLSKIEP